MIENSFIINIITYHGMILWYDTQVVKLVMHDIKYKNFLTILPSCLSYGFIILDSANVIWFLIFIITIQSFNIYVCLVYFFVFKFKKKGHP